MALIVNGTTISRVIYNGTEIQVLKFGNTTVFEAVYDITHTMTATTYTSFELRTYLMGRGWNGTSRLVGTLTIPSGAILRAANTSSYGAYLRNLSSTGDITLVNHGHIRGAGGAGGYGDGTSSGPGFPGGPALYVGPRGGLIIRFDNKGIIAGGGGGGAGAGGRGGELSGAGGGGGMGVPGGAAGAGGGSELAVAEPGTMGSPGRGGMDLYMNKGGDGGAVGRPGDDNKTPGGFIFAQGGAGGAAVVGNNQITWITQTGIYGERRNT